MHLCASPDWQFGDNGGGVGLPCGGNIEPGLEINTYRWEDAIDTASSGNPTSDSWNTLGYVVHLLEDLHPRLILGTTPHPCIGISAPAYGFAPLGIFCACTNLKLRTRARHPCSRRHHLYLEPRIRPPLPHLASFSVRCSSLCRQIFSAAILFSIKPSLVLSDCPCPRYQS